MTTNASTAFDKDALVGALATEWELLAQLCGDLDEAEWALPTECPRWSVKDNLAHIIGTELAMAGEPAPDIEVPVTAHLRNPMGEANERWVEQRRTRSADEVLAEFAAVSRSRIEALSAMSQADFDEPARTPAGDSTFGHMIRIRLFDSWMHDQDIRQATRRPGNESGPHVDLAIAEIVDAMGFVVGKRGGAPEGSRVRLDLTGPTRLVINVAVDGRARIVDAFDAEPTIGLTMPTLLFTRLCGGRRGVGDAVEVGEIELSGDEASALRIAENLGYMI